MGEGGIKSQQDERQFANDAWPRINCTSLQIWNNVISGTGTIRNA